MAVNCVFSPTKNEGLFSLRSLCFHQQLQITLFLMAFALSALSPNTPPKVCGKNIDVVPSLVPNTCTGRTKLYRDPYQSEGPQSLYRYPSTNCRMSRTLPSWNVEDRNGISSPCG